MKYLDLFAGYGGFSLGIQQAYEERVLDNKPKTNGLHPQKDSTSNLGQPLQGTPMCIGFSEVDSYAIKVYNKHFPKHKNYGDISKINPTTLPDFDLLTGGFPCQSFSIAGKRGGFDDTRGTLIFDVFRILKEKQPRLVLLENVKGLLSHDQGRTFKIIITSLAELGYAVEWQVLNAKNFGVPQNRERVFIVGHLGGFGGRQVFPIGGIDTKIAETPKGQLVDSRSTIDVATAIDANYNKGHGQRGKSRGRTQVLSNLKIRRLTPTECERLMGLPDGWTEGVSDTQRYKLCGNGVVVNVVKEIIKRLIFK